MPGDGQYVDVLDAGLVDNPKKVQQALNDAAASGHAVKFIEGLVYNIGATTLVIACDVLPGSETATLLYSGTGVAVICGTQTGGTQIRKKVIHLPRIVQSNKAAVGWAQAGGADIGLKLLNLYESQVYVTHIQNFSIGLNGRGEGTGCAYNNIHIGHIENNKINCQLDADATGFANENNFYGGRYSHQSAEGVRTVGTRHILTVDGVHPVNNNRWYGPSLEGNTAEYEVEHQGQYNYILFGRWETAGGAHVFWNGNAGLNCHSNVIMFGYNAELITVTIAATARYNHIFTRSGWKPQSIDGGSNGCLILSNSSSSGFPILTGLAAGDDPYVVTPGSAYSFALSANSLLGKRNSDTAGQDRIKIDFANGKYLVSDATAGATAGIIASGATGVSMVGANHGFFGAAAIAKPTATGSRAANAALASLLTALANLGLITDSTTA